MQEFLISQAESMHLAACRAVQSLFVAGDGRDALGQCMHGANQTSGVVPTFTYSGHADLLATGANAPAPPYSTHKNRLLQAEMKNDPRERMARQIDALLSSGTEEPVPRRSLSSSDANSHGVFQVQAPASLASAATIKSTLETGVTTAVLQSELHSAITGRSTKVGGTVFGDKRTILVVGSDKSSYVKEVV